MRREVAGVLLLFSFLGCGCSQQEGNGSALSADEARKEYWGEAQHLKLAPGWDWPPDTAKGTGILDTDPEDGNGMVYGKGYGRSWAVDYWFCSWSDRVISLDISNEQRVAAVSQVERVRQTYMYRATLNKDGQRFYDQMLDQVKLGDLSEMREYVRANCSEIRR